MFERIGQYLLQHHAFIGTERLIRLTACDAIKDVCAISCQPKDIRLQGKTLFVTLRPAAKTVVLMHKRDILAMLFAQHKEHAPRDIR